MNCRTWLSTIIKAPPAIRRCLKDTTRRWLMTLEICRLCLACFKWKKISNYWRNISNSVIKFVYWINKRKILQLAEKYFNIYGQLRYQTCISCWQDKLVAWCMHISKANWSEFAVREVQRCLSLKLAILAPIVIQNLTSQAFVQPDLKEVFLLEGCIFLLHQKIRSLVESSN